MIRKKWFFIALFVLLFVLIFSIYTNYKNEYYVDKLKEVVESCIYNYGVNYNQDIIDDSDCKYISNSIYEEREEDFNICKLRVKISQMKWYKKIFDIYINVEYVADFKEGRIKDQRDFKAAVEIEKENIKIIKISEQFQDE